jgi:hypothetical protein
MYAGALGVADKALAPSGLVKSITLTGMVVLFVIYMDNESNYAISLLWMMWQKKLRFRFSRKFA